MEKPPQSANASDSPVADAWENGPIFSTVEHDSRVTRLRPGFSVDQRLGNLLVGATVIAVCATLFVIGWAIFAGGEIFPNFWSLLLIIPTGLGVWGLGFALMEAGVSRFGRGGIGGALALAGILGGLALGLAFVGFFPLSSPVSMPINPGTLVAAALCLIGCLIVCATIPAARRAALSASERILRLRAEGHNYPGVVRTRPDPRTWTGQGEIRIRYTDSKGEHRLPVMLFASATRVPMPDTRLRVYVRAAPGTQPEPKDIHVELDPAHNPIFDPSTMKYERQADGGNNM